MFALEARRLAVTHDAVVDSAHTSALAVGTNGATNPALQVDASTTLSVTGLKVKSAAAAAGVALSAISSGTNEALTIDAKGSGTITLGGTSTGAIALSRASGVTGALTVTSAATSALAVGANGATTPAVQVDASTASSATGIKVTSAAAGAGVAVAAISSGTDEALAINAKGTGAITLGGASSGGVTVTQGGLTVTAGGLTVTAGGIVAPAITVSGVLGLTAATHSGRLLTLGGAGGYAVTLPLPTSGVSFRFAVRAAVTGSAITIGTSAGATIMNGVLNEVTDGTTAILDDATITVATTAAVGSTISLESDGTLWYAVINSGAQNGITTA